MGDSLKTRSCHDPFPFFTGKPIKETRSSSSSPFSALTGTLAKGDQTACSACPGLSSNIRHTRPKSEHVKSEGEGGEEVTEPAGVSQFLREGESSSRSCDKYTEARAVLGPLSLPSWRKKKQGAFQTDVIWNPSQLRDSHRENGKRMAPDMGCGIHSRRFDRAATEAFRPRAQVYKEPHERTQGSSVGNPADLRFVK